MSKRKVAVHPKEPDFQEVADQAARNSLEWIREEVAALNAAIAADDDAVREDAERTIHEGPLSVEVRSDWHIPGAEDSRAGEYNILLGTGGPASRIIGTLSEYGEPESAHFEYQDWFKPWTRARLSGEEEDVLLKYAQCFYFGE